MRRLLHTTTMAVLALAIPVAALANVTGTQALTAGQMLSLDTGTVVTSGGDILWSSAGITPQGSAMALSGSTFGLSGASQFASVSQTILQAVSPLFSSAAIPVSSLGVGAIVGVKTNGGNYAAALVTAQSGASITLQFITFTSGTGGGSSGPTISQVLNNYGLIPAGFSNSGIALGSLFIIKGSGLANTSTAVLQSSAAPGLQTSLNGASVSVTVSGTTTHPVFYYAIASQLALVMPSNTPVGTGTVTVTYNGQTTAPFNITVVASAMGFDTYDNGLGVATSPTTGALYTAANSIPPGATVVLWGSGLGADAARDTMFAGAAFNINNLANIYVGGVVATIQYQGASGYPGVNQVNVVIPANAPTGCSVSVIGVNAAGVPTNSITLPIGNGACSDPAFGIGGSTISSLSGKSTVNTGFVFLDQSTSPATNGSGTQVNSIALAAFQSYTGSTYSTSSVGAVSLGGCVISQNLSGSGTTGTATGLNAGTITVTGPSGSATLNSVGSFLPGFYEAQLASGFIPTSGGSFTVNGSGGSNVGAFNTTINYPNPVLNWTNQSAAATITHSSGVTVNWTGGSSGTFVLISGSSLSGSASGGFTCIAPVGADTFTVPAYVLAAMPAGSGSLTVSNYTNYTTFQATGLDYAYAAGFVSYSINTTYN